jgi:hypothetical protein
MLHCLRKLCGFSGKQGNVGNSKVVGEESGISGIISSSTKQMCVSHFELHTEFALVGISYYASDCLRKVSVCLITAFSVSEDSLQKNITHISKSVKQLEIDIKNALQDKNAPPNDQFLPVMTISF